MLVEEVSSDENINSKSKRKGKGKGKEKRKRTATADVPPEESRSSAHLPDFIVPYMSTEFVPSVLDHLGNKTNPWALNEQGNNELLNICRTVLAAVCPDAGYTLEKNDVIYKVVRFVFPSYRAHKHILTCCADSTGDV